MNRRRLGKTGLEVSEIGFGGIPVTRVDQEEAVGLIRRGFELGLNFFDTANMYGDSEAKMGLALAPFRDRVVIATKTAARDAKTAEAHLKQSLAALKTDRIDLYQAHNVSTQEDLDKLLAPEGAYGFMVRARGKGLIRHIGLSSHNPAIAQQAVETGLFETLQYPFNFLETGALDSLFPAAQGLDMGLIGMKPLGGGILEEARLCFGFLREYPQVIPIPGIQARAELEEIVGLYRKPPALTPGSGRPWRRSRPNWATTSAAAAATACPVPRASRSPLSCSSSPR